MSKLQAKALQKTWLNILLPEKRWETSDVEIAGMHAQQAFVSIFFSIYDLLW